MSQEAKDAIGVLLAMFGGMALLLSLLILASYLVPTSPT